MGDSHRRNATFKFTHGLAYALFSFGIKADDATAKATFAAADTDSSGDVSFEEFSRFVKNGDGDASKAFKRGLLGVA